MANIQISPGNAHLPSCLYLPYIRPCFPGSFRTLKIYDFSSSIAASYTIPVRQASNLPAASFRPHLTVTALAVQLMVPATGPIGDLHSQASVPCRAHIKKPPFPRRKRRFIMPNKLRPAPNNHQIRYHQRRGTHTNSSKSREHQNANNHRQVF